MRDPSFSRYARGLQVSLAGAGALALVLGTAVYLLDRDWQSAWFLTQLAGLTSWHAPGGVFGDAGQWLPSLTHSFAFALLMATVVARGAWSHLAMCGAWVAIGLFFELAQLDSVLPLSLPGQFDVRDLAATLVGGLAACLLLVMTAPLEPATWQRARPSRVRRRVRRSATALVGVLGVGSLVASGPGSEGPTDVRPSTSELAVYGFSLGGPPTPPAALSFTTTRGTQDYTDVLTFSAPGITGNYDTTLGFRLDAGSVLHINTDGATAHLGAFSVVVLDSLGWFDGIFLYELDGGSYRVNNGVDSVTVHVLPRVPDPPPTASFPFLTFEVALNGSAPVVLEWLEFNAESGPLAQRQAARALVLLSSLFDDAAPALLLAESRADTSITSVPEASNCDGFRPGADPPPGLPARGSVTVSRTAGPNNGHDGDFDFGFADCSRIHDSIFSNVDRLYRGNITTTGWINTVDASNVLTNFGFESASFAGLRVNALRTENPTLILEPGLTLDGEFGLVFFPP